MIPAPATLDETRFCAVEFFGVLEAAQPIYAAIEKLPAHRRRRHIETVSIALLLFLNNNERAQSLEIVSKIIRGSFH